MEIITVVSRTLCEADTTPVPYKNNPANTLMAILQGRALGLGPVQSLNCIALIRGKMSLYGDGFLGVIQSHPLYTGHQEMTMAEIQKEGRAVCTFYRAGKAHVATYSIEDAKRQKLWGNSGPWSTIPFRMLQMRARGFAGRNAFSDALKGLVIREEADDLQRIEDREAAEALQGTPAIETRQIRAQLAPPKRDPIEEATVVVAREEPAAPKASEPAAPKASKPAVKRARPRKPPVQDFVPCPE